MGYFHQESGGQDTYYYKDLWEYDPLNDAWTKKADFPNGRFRAVAFAIGNKGYVGTGYKIDTPNVSKDIWAYDPSSNTWTQKADLPNSPKVLAVGFSIGGKGYIGTGGTDSVQFTKDFWAYDTLTNSWAQQADFGGSARNGAVGLSIGGKGYIGTGSDGFSSLKDFWEYTPAADCMAPTNLTTTNITATTAKLRWNKVADATKYKLKFRRDSSGAEWYGIFINPPDTFFSVSNLQPGGKYAWKIKSICSNEKSGFSAVKKFTTLLRLSEGLSTTASLQVYPNPFAATAVISFSVQSAAASSIILYDLKGTKVETILKKELEAGAYQIPFDRKNLASGIYLLRLKLDSETSVMKVVIE